MSPSTLPPSSTAQPDTIPPLPVIPMKHFRPVWKRRTGFRSPWPAPIRIIPGSTQTLSAGSVVSWADVPTGTAFSVTETIPAGYGNPWIYCEFTVASGLDTYYFEAPNGILDMNAFDPSLLDSPASNCWWFNVSLAPVETATAPITIATWFCSPSDQVNGGATFDELIATCPPGELGKTFTVEPEGQPGIQITTGVDGVALSGSSRVVR